MDIPPPLPPPLLFPLNETDPAAAAAAAAAAADKSSTSGAASLSSGSDDSQISSEAPISVEDRLALADSLREEGNRRLKEGDLNGAVEAYENGVAKLKGEVVADCLKQVAVALNSNLSLVYFKQEKWGKAVQAATAALAIDKSHVKALLRRGMAQSRRGFTDDAYADLLRVCELDKQMAPEIRRELQLIKERELAAAKRDKQNFANMFSKITGALYQDREREMQLQKEKEKRESEALIEQYEIEKNEREAKGESPLPSFDSWRSEREEAAKKRRTTESAKEQSPSAVQQRKVSRPVTEEDDLDEEDRKIIDETSKMGYCYFNSKKSTQTPTSVMKPKQLPQLPSTSRPRTQQRALSAWNSQGTTYEEKDCSKWAREELQRLLLDGPGGASHVGLTAVDELEGEANAVVIRGERRCLFDFKLSVSWEMEGGTSGSLSFSEISSAAAVSADGSPDWVSEGQSKIVNRGESFDEGQAKEFLTKLAKYIAYVIETAFPKSFEKFSLIN